LRKSARRRHCPDFDTLFSAAMIRCQPCQRRCHDAAASYAATLSPLSLPDSRWQLLRCRQMFCCYRLICAALPAADAIYVISPRYRRQAAIVTRLLLARFDAIR
jgi:hypothetical protein